MTPIQITAERYEQGEIIPGFAIPSITRFLDMRVECHDTAAAVLRLSFSTRPEYANPHNSVNGGILAAMLDDAMNCLILAQTGGSKLQVSTDLHTSFFRPAPIGPRVTVVARIDRMGRSVAFTSAEALNDKGEVLARAVHTAAFIQPPTNPAGAGSGAASRRAT
jgi:uncharacterized protein (TIGR00369 family)